jgi:flagellar biosynthesis protein FliQ
VTFATFLAVFPWMMRTMVSFTHALLSSFDAYVR